MSKKDYQLIAAIIRRFVCAHIEQGQRHRVANELASEFIPLLAADNSRFNASTFRNACTAFEEPEVTSGREWPTQELIDAVQHMTATKQAAHYIWCMNDGPAIRKFPPMPGTWEHVSVTLAEVGRIPNHYRVVVTYVGKDGRPVPKPEAV